MPVLVEINNSPATLGLTAMSKAEPVRAAEAVDHVDPELVVIYNLLPEAAYKTVAFTLSAATTEPTGKLVIFVNEEEYWEIMTLVEGELGTHRMVLLSADIATFPPYVPSGAA